MTTIVATTASLVVPGQVRGVARMGSDSDSTPPAAFMDMVADAPRRAMALRPPMEMAGRALTPTATPPLAPSTLAVMIEMQAYAAEPQRAAVRRFERRARPEGWDVGGEIDAADDGEIAAVPPVAARAYGHRQAA
jgi:hypothetical protein